MSNINSMSFDLDKEEGKKLALKWIQLLMERNEKCEDYYCDIHMYQQDTLLILEWAEVPFSHNWGGEFKYVDEDQYVVKEIRFPDGHYDYARDEDEEKELWENFHKENPGWVKTSYGSWTNEIENARFRKELGLDKEDE